MMNTKTIDFNSWVGSFRRHELKEGASIPYDRKMSSYLLSSERYLKSRNFVYLLEATGEGAEI